MIDSVLNLIFRCRHKRLTRPVTPAGKDKGSHEETYVACLDCGKHFSYDLTTMTIGKPLSRSGPVAVMPPDMPAPHRSKLKLAMMAVSIPIGLAVGSLMKSKRSKGDKPPGSPNANR
jgi:hypothetical protein